MPALDAVAEATSLLEQWERDNSSGTSPADVLDKLATLVEKEIEAWYKFDPDPFDDRHPGRSDPNCSLGHVLKAVFKHENFMNKLVKSYLVSREHSDLHVVSARLMLDIMPGLETSMVYADNEPLVRKLMEWAEHSDEPLRYYAVGLLAGAMDVQDVVVKFKDYNSLLVPILLDKLHELKAQQQKENLAKSPIKSPARSKVDLQRPFANIGKLKESSQTKTDQSEGEPPPKNSKGDGDNQDQESPSTSRESNEDKSNSPPRKKARKENEKSTSLEKRMTSKVRKNSTETASPYRLTSKIHMNRPSREDGDGKQVNECSNSTWADLQPYVIGQYPMWPLSTEMQQRLILLYLTPMGEYQELLGNVFEKNAMELIFFYIDLAQNFDVMLAFNALRYLASLLCHKKFAVEFINEGGVQRLLAVHRPSVAATGVSMCLYYLAYFEDTMERVCLLPHNVLSDLVSYVLWLLECSHESGRCHATMFFSMAFPFRVVLELFDRQDGLRKLFNVISTLSILNIEEDNSTLLSEDEIFTSRQAARHVCVALKKYYEAHLAIKADQLRRSHLRNEGGSPLVESPAYKASTFPPEVIEDSLELLLECLPYRIKWTPVAQMLQLEGLQLLLQLVAMAAEWSAYVGKVETIRSALDVLRVCTVTPQNQLQLCQAVHLPESVQTPAISILLGLAEGELIGDADVQKSALNIINNCVCGPLSRLSGSVGRIVRGSTRKKLSLRNGEDLLGKMWSNVRSNNGIMVLLKLLMVKTPITEADAIRGLACKALVGLARSDTVKQIIGKLPLVNDGRLQMLMKEPVLQDKRQEHVKFCKFAQDLLEMVSGKAQTAAVGATLEMLRKADVVAQTRILYRQKELLQLIHSHLLSIGLEESAHILQREADLPRATSPSVIHPSSPHLFSSPSTTPRLLRQVSTPAAVEAGSSFHTSNLASPGTPLGPIRVNIISSKTQCAASRIQQSKRIIHQKHEAASAATNLLSPILPSHGRRPPAITGTPEPPTQDRAPGGSSGPSTASLDKIVTEYLREQHACCKNPVVTCPPFSLFSPHRCPEPRHRRAAPVNVTSRHFRRSILPRYGGPEGLKCDRKFIYSRFRPIRSFRDPEDDGCFSCCAFAANEQYLVLGTYSGAVKLFNLQSAEEVGVYECATSPINHCEPSRDGKLILTSSSWGRPLSSLWSIGDFFDLKYGFAEDTYVEFSKHTQDRIIGTREEKAQIYDVATGEPIIQLYDQDKANNYTRNRATFSPTDDMVLNDGVLWDVNSGKAIHKFDKFNPNVSGVFHPSGLEVVINMEVWDLRTFHLLHTVPGLDQCHIRFNQMGDVIYGAIHQLDEDDEGQEDTIKSPFGSSFRTFDARDYSNIATVDVKRNIFDLCTDSTDSYLAVIENQRSEETLSEESTCHLYQVGRRKDSEDDQGEEEEEEEEDDDMDDEDEDIDDDASHIEDEDDGDAEDDPDSENSDDDAARPDDIDEDDDDNEEEDGDSDFDISEEDMDDDDDDNDDLDSFLFELSDLSNM